MTTAVDTVVPVARGQVRASRTRRTRSLLVLVPGTFDDYWKVMILTGPMRTDIVELTRDWIERWSEVVKP